MSHPRKYDSVLGGKSAAPINSAVLGGIEGVKQRLSSQKIESRIAACKEALNYGEEGLALLLLALNNPDEKVHFAAYQLLKCREEPDVKIAVAKYIQYYYFIFCNGLYCSKITPLHYDLIKFYQNGTVWNFTLTFHESINIGILGQAFNQNKDTADKLIYDFDGKDIKFFTPDRLTYRAKIESVHTRVGYITVFWESFFVEDKIQDYQFFYIPDLK